MAKRKVGNNKRQPRVTASGINTKCISYFVDDPNGTASFFKPKKREQQMQIGLDKKGKFVVVKRDRSLI